MQPIYIYVIANLLNTLTYVGQTVNPKRRWREHKHGKDPNSRVHQAIRNIGEENFIFSIVETCSNRREARIAETNWIGRLNSIENGYNVLRDGGSAPPQEVIEKIRSKLAGRRLSPATEFKPGHSLGKVCAVRYKGEHHSPETEIKPGQHLSSATEFKPGRNAHNKKPITPEQITQIKELYASGLGTSDIVRTTGLTVKITKRILNDLQLPTNTNKKRFSPEQIANIHQLYLNGTGQRTIAKQYNVDRDVIKRILTELNLLPSHANQ